MATAIRPIPTLQGEDAERFEQAALEVEANPGTIKISKQDIELVRNVLRNLNM